MKKKPKDNVKKSKSIAKALAKKSGLTIGSALIIVGLIILVLIYSNIKYLSTHMFVELTAKGASTVYEKTSLGDSLNTMVMDYVSGDYDKLKIDDRSRGAYSTIVPNAPLTNSANDMEIYLKQFLKNQVRNNSMVDGAGLFFEPYQMDPALEKYGLYVMKDENGEDGIRNIFDETPWGREYYTKVVETGEKYVSPPYSDKFNKYVVTISSPVKVNGKVIAVAFVDLALSEIQHINLKDERYKTLNSVIVDHEGRVVFHSDDDSVMGSKLVDLFKTEKDKEIIENRLKGEEQFFEQVSFEEGKKRMAFFAPIKMADKRWWIYTSAEMSDLKADFYQLAAIVIVLFAAALILLGFFMIAIIKKSMMPLTHLQGAGAALTRGEFKYKIEYTEEDEIGKICMAIQEAFHHLDEIIGEISLAMSSLGKGNLTYMPTKEYPGDFAEIRESYLALIEGLNSGMNKIKLSASQINEGSDQVSQGAQSLSQSSTEQAASVQQLSATIGDIAEKISANAKSADEANELSDQIGEAIDASNAHMSELMAAMEKMTEASNEVNKIIKTIDDIAFQTNILALNAAVEAARAGEAGKGFAVVADEVRNLASKSAEAAKSTTTLIETSIEAVSDGKDIADKTAQSLDLVVQNARTITTKIKEILASSEEQAMSASQINLGVDQISAAVQTNSATSEESAAASEELAGQATVLNSIIAQYQLLEDGELIRSKKAEVTKVEAPRFETPRVEAAIESPKMEFKSDTGSPRTQVKFAVEPKKPTVEPVKNEKPLAPKPQIETKVESKDVVFEKVTTENDGEKTDEILAYENTKHDISQVKELPGERIPAAKTGSVTEISDIDNKYF